MAGGKSPGNAGRWLGKADFGEDAYGSPAIVRVDLPAHQRPPVNSPSLLFGGCATTTAAASAKAKATWHRLQPMRRVWHWRDRPRSCVPRALPALPVRGSADVRLLELLVVRSGVWHSRTRTDRPERGATGQPAARERVTPTADEEGGASHPSAPGVPQRARLTRERGTPTADEEGGASRPSAPGVPERARLTRERVTPTADEEGGASHPSAPGVPQRARLTRGRGTPTEDEEGGASHPSAPGVPQRVRLTSANLWRCPIRKNPSSDWRSRSPFPLAAKLTSGTPLRQPFLPMPHPAKATWHRLEPVRLILSAQGKAGSAGDALGLGEMPGIDPVGVVQCSNHRTSGCSQSIPSVNGPDRAGGSPGDRFPGHRRRCHLWPGLTETALQAGDPCQLAVVALRRVCHHDRRRFG